MQREELPNVDFYRNLAFVARVANDRNVPETDFVRTVCEYPLPPISDIQFLGV